MREVRVGGGGQGDGGAPAPRGSAHLVVANPLAGDGDGGGEDAGAEELIVRPCVLAEVLQQEAHRLVEAEVTAVSVQRAEEQR